ncbi:MAG TPA: GNAT family N-acetyltransferase [Candidatus Binataceae bacterium]|nr:GNAT family N-acetyltransferase [Candidatus Binataceae bacterium]
MASRVKLKPADRGNWLQMMRLELRDDQKRFVTPPGWALGRAYVRSYGDRYEHLPMVICDSEDTVIGYVATVSDPGSADDYWVDDIMIDVSQQGHGYGREAMEEVLRFLTGHYPLCRTVKLVCFRANTEAAALYKTMGFNLTGDVDSIFSEPIYALTGKGLEKYRTS